MPDRSLRLLALALLLVAGCNKKSSTPSSSPKPKPGTVTIKGTKIDKEGKTYPITAAIAAWRGDWELGVHAFSGCKPSCSWVSNGRLDERSVRQFCKDSWSVVSTQLRVANGVRIAPGTYTNKLGDRKHRPLVTGYVSVYAKEGAGHRPGSPRYGKEMTQKITVSQISADSVTLRLDYKAKAKTRYSRFGFLLSVDSTPIQATICPGKGKPKALTATQTSVPAWRPYPAKAVIDAVFPSTTFPSGYSAATHKWRARFIDSSYFAPSWYFTLMPVNGIPGSDDILSITVRPFDPPFFRGGGYYEQCLGYRCLAGVSRSVALLVGRFQVEIKSTHKLGNESKQNLLSILKQVAPLKKLETL